MVLTNGLESQSKVSDMIIKCFAIGKNIIKENNNELSEKGFKHIVHKGLKSDSCIEPMATLEKRPLRSVNRSLIFQQRFSNRGVCRRCLFVRQWFLQT